MDTTNQARALADLDACLAGAPEDQRGVLWRLAESSRQLDANLVRLPPDAHIEPHAEDDLDVLLLPLSGGGTLHTAAGAVPLTPHAVTWLPRGSRRAVTAGPEGIAYLTVHRARPGLRIQLPTDPAALRRLEEREEAAAAEGGENACSLVRVCPTCGALPDGPRPDTCPVCGTPWPA